MYVNLGLLYKNPALVEKEGQKVEFFASITTNLDKFLLKLILARILVSPAAFCNFLMDRAGDASRVTIKKCQRTLLAGDRSTG